MPQHSVEQLSPWTPLLNSLIPMLRQQMGVGAGPMYPGVMAAQQSPMQQMARQMAMMRAGGQMPRQRNPFAESGYQTGDLGSGGGPGPGMVAGGPGHPGQKGAGGGGGIPPELMEMFSGAGGASGGAGGMAHNRGPEGGEPLRGDRRAEWMNQLQDYEMWPGAQLMIGANAPFFTPAANPYAPYGGQNPAAKGELMGPLLQAHTADAQRTSDLIGSGPPGNPIAFDQIQAGRQ